MATNASRPLLVERYRVERRLGSGGMGTVFLARDERLGREVAVKRLPADSPEDTARRFEREARLGASLNHRNIVSIFDTATDDDGVLIVMEYVAGPTLADELAGGRLEQDRTLQILRGVAAALDHAHGQGVVHRDVKPANVLLGRDGSVKLADLGIATATEGVQITRTGTVLGTPSYMAPEQLEGGALGPAVDVYALAAVAYEALGGQKARPGRTPLEIAHRTANLPPPDLRDHWPGAPEAVVEALKRGMARDPAERPASAGALTREVEHGLVHGAATEATQAMAATGGGARRAAGLGSSGAAAGSGSAPVAAAEPAPARPRPAPDGPPPSPRPVPMRGRSRTRWVVPAALAAIAALLVAGFLLISPGGGSDSSRSSSGSTGADRQRTRAERSTTSPTAPSTPGAGGAASTGSPTTETNAGQPAFGGGSDPARGGALNDRGYALSQQGDDEAAVPILQQAVASFPEDSSGHPYDFALFNLGHSLRASGRPAEAIPYLERRLSVSSYKRGEVQRELALARQQAAGG